jgi:hypothetical protein
VRKARNKDDIGMPQRSDCSGAHLRPGGIRHECARGAGKRNRKPGGIVLERRSTATEQGEFLPDLCNGESVQFGREYAKERRGFRRKPVARQ